MKRLAILTPLLMLLAACGGGSDHNDADIAFAQGMVGHHEQAVDMSVLARANGASPEVQALADQIEAAQEPEIETMNGWLEEWGVTGDDHHGAHGDHGSMDHDMAGMASEAELAQLAEATGADFDRLFLTLMIAHHEGAVTMCSRVIETGKSRSVQELARQIVETQEAEITAMKELLG